MARPWRIEFKGALYLPEKLHKEIPQQRDLSKSIDPIARLNEAARLLDCDLNF